MPRIDIYSIQPTPHHALAKKWEIEARYPPQGYGTNLKVVEKEDKDGTYYVVEGFHYDTCD